MQPCELKSKAGKKLAGKASLEGLMIVLFLRFDVLIFWITRLTNHLYVRDTVINQSFMPTV